MEDIAQEIEISANDRLMNNQDFLRRMQKNSYLTTTEENYLQFNELDSYTTRINRLQSGPIFVFPLTSGLVGEVDLTEEIDAEWANIAKLSRERWSKENPY